MISLKSLIGKIIVFGTHHIQSEDNVRDLKKLLVELYSLFLQIEVGFDETNYEDRISYEYCDIRKQVEVNFPNLGMYWSVHDSQKIMSDADVVVGDAIDDITDIINDLLKVKWCFENTSEIDAVWHFDFLMRSHSEQHLLDLLKHFKNCSE